MRFILTLVAAALLATDVTASDLKGKVKDAKTGEELIGAAVFVKEYPTIGATTGLDGSFVLSGVPEGKEVTLVCSYISYATAERRVRSARWMIFRAEPMPRPWRTVPVRVWGWPR